MKIKFLSYFLIITAGLLPAQQAHASWQNNAKSLLSSGAQWVKSSLMHSSKPVAQQRGILTPHEFKDLHSSFKPEFAHLSPLTGVALMPNLTSIYLYGGPESAFTKLLKNPSYGLFHHNETGLHPTSNKTIPASSWGPEFLGTLAADIHLNRMQDANWTKNDFIPRAKKSHTDAFGKRGNVSTSRIEQTAQVLAESQKEMIDSTNKVALYPNYYLPAVPAAMLMHKAKTKQDAVDYIQALHHRLLAHKSQSPLKNPESFFGESERRTNFSGADFKQSLEQPIERVVADEDTFETHLAAETDRRLNGSIVPQQVKQMRYGYNGNNAVPNCSEAALQDLCNIILAGPDGIFDLSKLPKTIKPLENFKEFYSTYGSYKAINDHTTGQTWMNLVSGHNGIKYYQENTKYEIRSYLDNLLKMLNILFGTTAQTYAEFGQQISSEQRTVIAKVFEEDKRVRFTIDLHYETITAFLSVNPGKHTWLDVIEREHKKTNTENTPWDNELIRTLNDENTPPHHRFNAELLLPQRQNISFTETIQVNDSHDLVVSKFKPKTVAQATHIAYASAENSDATYDLIIKDLLHGKDKQQTKAILTTFIEAEKGRTNSKLMQTLWFGAAIANDLPLIELLVEAGIDINMTDEKGETLLHKTAQPNIWLPLLEKGIDVNAQNNEGETALIHFAHFASIWFSAEEFKSYLALFIKHGADLNIKDVQGNTLLHSVIGKDASICKILLEAGAHVDAKNNVGETPLLKATFKNASRTCKLLLKHGANINATDQNGNTLLILTILETKRKCTLNPTLQNHCNLPAILNAMLFAANKPSIQLIELGADVNAKNIIGSTALHYASLGNASMCKELLKAGANVNEKDAFEETPLRYAQQAGKDEICRILIEHGATS